MTRTPGDGCPYFHDNDSGNFEPNTSALRRQLSELVGRVMTLPYRKNIKKSPGSEEPGDIPLRGRRTYFFRDSSTATATETVMPTMGLLPAPRKPRKLRLRFGKHLK